MTDRPPIRVPSRAVPTLDFLASLSDQDQDSIAEALAGRPVPVSVKALRKRIVPHLGATSDPEKMARDVVGELFGIASVAADHGWDFQAVSVVVAETDGVSVPEGQRAAFADFLHRCLTSVTVKTLGKAAGLAREHSRRLHTVRVVTDLTPIFDAPDEEPVGGLVMHRLRMDCFTDSESDDVVEVALTTEQLEELAGVITRAQQKASSLDAVLGRLSLSALSPIGEH